MLKHLQSRPHDRMYVHRSDTLSIEVSYVKVRGGGIYTATARPIQRTSGGFVSFALFDPNTITLRIEDSKRFNARRLAQHAVRLDEHVPAILEAHRLEGEQRPAALRTVLDAAFGGVSSSSLPRFASQPAAVGA